MPEVLADHTTLRLGGPAREWVTANMADLIPDPPEVSMGEMLVDAATFGEAAASEAAAEVVPQDAMD